VFLPPQISPERSGEGERGRGSQTRDPAVGTKADLLGEFEEHSPGGIRQLLASNRCPDPDADRRGIVTPSTGLMNPNHYLADAIFCLLTHALAQQSCCRKNSRQQQHDRSRRA